MRTDQGLAVADRHLHRQARPLRKAWAGLALALAWGLAGGASAQAMPHDGRSHEGKPATLAAAAAAGPLCAQQAEAAASMDQLASQLRANGLALKARCHADTGAWVVQVEVTDGFKASKVVRGPLADGEPVDMGTPAGLVMQGASVGAQGLSPDVVYNRQWLRKVMAQHRFDNLTQGWWLFAQTQPSPARNPGVSLAAR
jgi:D-alanyl-D-alanine dipeptidase